MTDKTPLDKVIESFTFGSLSRDLLENKLSEDASLADLKKEHFYYAHQAVNGPEKSRHVMKQKADELKQKIDKLENTVDEDLVKKTPLQVSEEEPAKEKSLEEDVLNNFLKNVRK